MSKNFSILARFKSFKHPFNSIKVLVKEEHNARVHIVAVICVVFTVYFFFRVASYYTLYWSCNINGDH